MSNETIQNMHRVLELQKNLNIKEGAPDIKLRTDRLERVISMVTKNEKAIIAALQEDFGNRDPVMTAATEVASVIGPMEHAKKNLKKWMKTEKRKAAIAPLGSALSLLGAKAEIRYQPKGVVGAISPWNFPLNLALAPLSGILAAGNRVMLKPSELTPSSSDITKSMIEEYFDESEMAVFVGDPEVGAAFSGLAFDHLIFTGGTAIAKHVMKAASENLVPLTLELGGKSPVVIGKSSKIKEAAQRVMQGKTMNAGQICLAPDYALVPEENIDEFVKAAVDVTSEMYPDMKDNEDFTSIINQKHYDRIQGYLADAKEKGAEVVEINPANEDFSQQPHHKIPPTLVLNPTDDMQIMREEIFGPVLPIKTYSDVSETVDYINSKDRPLGLYYFGEDSKEKDYVLNNTTSGGVTVNDVISHIQMEDLPFGGVGPSGMGSYHGHDGFKEFSHAKAVYKQTKINLMKLAGLVPPYKKKEDKPSA
ncbi:MAG TPA: coniferyl aldehyde dehydrogenase [Gammaproteobacteria bacterium]|nr:coniferyl aldehyde dehydrogenase [Gammaproteobacteria bacterium]HIK72101.1 coniferyl aldehyde dehydrogenase [Gammaproteobacteria bacterium]